MKKSNVKTGKGTRKRARIIDDDSHDSTSRKRRTVDGDYISFSFEIVPFFVVSCHILLIPNLRS